MVPDMDGYEVLRWVRENFDWPVPIVFVTAKDDEDDIVRALEQGADDYIVKPAKQRELVARITAVARRSSPIDESQTTIEYEPFAIDLGNHEVKRDGERIEVTQKEYELIVSEYRADIVARPHSRARMGMQSGHQHADGRYPRQPDPDEIVAGGRDGLKTVLYLSARIPARTHHLLNDRDGPCQSDRFRCRESVWQYSRGATERQRIQQAT